MNSGYFSDTAIILYIPTGVFLPTVTVAVLSSFAVILTESSKAVLSSFMTRHTKLPCSIVPSIPT